MKNYPYPLPERALADYCHPLAGHVFGAAVRHEGEVLAVNGYVALRCTRGWWVTEEFSEAGAEYMERFDALPWGQVLTGEWRALSDLGAGLWVGGELEMWALGSARLAVSPVWRVGDSLCRLSLLQAVARLPRCEVFIGASDREDPVFFRFSGGRGLIAYDARLTLWSRHVFAPQHDCLTGERVTRSNRPKPNFALPGWPPPEVAD